MMIQLIASLVAVFFSAIFFEAPFRLTPYIAGIGCLGWLVYYYFYPLQGYAFATFYGALLVATLSHLAARRFKAPVTVFFLPGFFPLVPGAGMYRAAFSYLSGDSLKGQAYLGNTLMTAGMIALAVFIVDSLFRFQYLWKLRKSKQRARLDQENMSK